MPQNHQPHRSVPSSTIIAKLTSLTSYSNKVLFLGRGDVTGISSKKTAPVWTVEIWNTPQKKAQAVKELKVDGYQQQPLRRIYILKAKGKIRSQPPIRSLLRFPASERRPLGASPTRPSYGGWAWATINSGTLATLKAAHPQHIAECRSLSVR